MPGREAPFAEQCDARDKRVVKRSEEPARRDTFMSDPLQLLDWDRVPNPLPHEAGDQVLNPSPSLCVHDLSRRADEYVLEELACTATRSTIDVPGQSLLERQPSALEDLGIETL
jgi:hypothetical protein